MTELRGRFLVFCFAGVTVLVTTFFGQSWGYLLFGAAAVGSYEVGKVVGARMRGE